MTKHYQKIKEKIRFELLDMTMTSPSRDYILESKLSKEELNSYREANLKHIDIYTEIIYKLFNDKTIPKNKKSKNKS